MCRPDRLDLGNRRTHCRFIRYNMCLSAFVCVCVLTRLHICNDCEVKFKHARGCSLPQYSCSSQAAVARRFAHVMGNKNNNNAILKPTSSGVLVLGGLLSGPKLYFTYRINLLIHRYDCDCACIEAASIPQHSVPLLR